MLKVFTADDRVLFYHIKNLIESEGITCMVKNDHSMSLAGEVPSIECWPELWVVSETEYGKAESIVKDYLAQTQVSGDVWQCSGCGEENEPQFSICWNCGKEN